MKKSNVKNRHSPIVESVIRGVNGLLHRVVDMNKRGVSEEVYQGELRGKTKHGQDIQVKYGYGIKVGLDDFVEKLEEEHVGHDIDRTSK